MGLLDILLQGTRFDQRSNLDKRIQAQPGLQQGQPVAQPAPQGGNGGYQSPDDMIRELRRKRAMEQQGLAMQALQQQNGQVLPKRY